jgi:hypothetical protein
MFRIDGLTSVGNAGRAGSDFERRLIVHGEGPVRHSGLCGRIVVGLGPDNPVGGFAQTCCCQSTTGSNRQDSNRIGRSQCHSPVDCPYPILSRPTRASSSLSDSRPVDFRRHLRRKRRSTRRTRVPWKSRSLAPPGVRQWWIQCCEGASIGTPVLSAIFRSAICIQLLVSHFRLYTDRCRRYKAASCSDQIRNNGSAYHAS